MATPTFLTRNPIAARISPGALVRNIRFDSSDKRLHMQMDSAGFLEHMQHLLRLGRMNINIELRTGLRYCRSKKDRVERIVKMLEPIAPAVKLLEDAGFRDVVFRVEELDLTHLAGQSESVVKVALVSLEFDIVRGSLIRSS
jgi:hypothetical protein